MSVEHYRKQVVTLLIKPPGVPKDHLDWAGSAGVLALYQASDSTTRREVTEAMAEILKNPRSRNKKVFADLIHICSSLSIWDVFPSVEALSEDSVAMKNPTLSSAVSNFLAFHQLDKHAYLQEVAAF